MADARAAKSLTQATLAAATGVGQGTISRVESGRHKPSDRLRQAIARVLGVSASVLFAYPEDEAA